MSPAPAGLVGVLLAGGPGRRMGGGKPWRTLGGRPLIEWSLDALDQACGQVVVLAADAAEMADLPRTIITDRWPAQGPLAALVTAFLDTDAQGVLLLAVDLPLARPALLRRLAQAQAQPRPPQVLAPIGPQGWPEYLLAYYSRACLPPAQRLLAQGETRIRRLVETVRLATLDPAEVRTLDPEGLSFLNLNRPEELAEAEVRARDCGLIDTLPRQPVSG